MGRGDRIACRGAWGVVLGVLVSLASSAQAESGVVNAHGSFGVGGPVTGELSAPGADGADRLIPAGWIGLDWQVERPWAVELLIGFGRQFERSNTIGAADQSYWSALLGARLRLFDDTEGYLTEGAGNPWGHLWVSAHIGYFGLDDAEFGADVGVGYQFSIARPMQLGPFLRAAVADGGGFDGVHLMLWGGIEASFALLLDNAQTDLDGDGLGDERELELGTDPRSADTDGDGLNDRLESESDTDPLDRDTDGDGLLDGAEDRNRNGRVDAGETNPMVRDTDGGGLSDGEEARAGLDPLDRSDDRRPPEPEPTAADGDGDGVEDELDLCPDTAAGSTVRPDGCAVFDRPLELEGVRFRVGRATITRDSEAALEEAAALLRDNPDVRVEVAGHTDDQGAARGNQVLSQRRAQAVVRWLTEHGIDASRLEARGYGETQPTASNATPEGRARNRRIEFRRLD